MANLDEIDAKDPIVTTLYAQISQEENRIRRLQEVSTKITHAFYVRIHERVSALLGIPYDNLCIGSHECEKSPCGVCCYNLEEDPSYDDCIICHEPATRK